MSSDSSCKIIFTTESRIVISDINITTHISLLLYEFSLKSSDLYRTSRLPGFAREEGWEGGEGGEEGRGAGREGGREGEEGEEGGREGGREGEGGRGPSEARVPSLPPSSLGPLSPSSLGPLTPFRSRVASLPPSLQPSLLYFLKRYNEYLAVAV